MSYTVSIHKSAIKSTQGHVFLCGYSRDPFDVPSGGEGVFTHKHLLVQPRVHKSNQAATLTGTHSTYGH